MSPTAPKMQRKFIAPPWERMVAMGEYDSGVAIIRKNIGSLSGMDLIQPHHTSIPYEEPIKISLFSSQATQQGWIVDKPAEFTDEGRLMATILLTCLVNHSHLP